MQAPAFLLTGPGAELTHVRPVIGRPSCRCSSLWRAAWEGGRRRRASRRRRRCPARRCPTRRPSAGASSWLTSLGQPRPALRWGSQVRGGRGAAADDRRSAAAECQPSVEQCWACTVGAGSRWAWQAGLAAAGAAGCVRAIPCAAHPLWEINCPAYVCCLAPCRHPVDGPGRIPARGAGLHLQWVWVSSQPLCRAAQACCRSELCVPGHGLDCALLAPADVADVC